MRRRNNDIYHHVEELTLENERLHQENKKLRIENRELRAENARIHKRIEVLETTMEERIAKAVEEAVAKGVAPLQTIIAEKDKEILRLKSQLGKDSSNSSKPSGSNGFKKIPNHRERSDKKQGGQAPPVYYFLISTYQLSYTDFTFYFFAVLIKILC